MTVHIFHKIILTVAISLLSLYSFCQDTNSNFKNSVFENYKFNKQSAEFIRKIEPYFAKINIVEKELSFSEHGFSSVNNDTAVILINYQEKDREELIIHELYHIYLKILGFPTPVYSFSSASENSKKNNEYLTWFSHLFWDKIQHYYFYPLMLKDLNINPYNSLKTEIIEAIHNNEIKGLSPATQELGLSGYYLQVWIETKDKKLLKKFRKFLIDKYQGIGVENGEKLISLYDNVEIKGKDDVINLYTGCFNLLHKNQNLTLKLSKMEKLNHSKYLEYFAIFSFSVSE